MDRGVLSRDECNLKTIIIGKLIVSVPVRQRYNLEKSSLKRLTTMKSLLFLKLDTCSSFKNLSARKL